MKGTLWGRARKLLVFPADAAIGVVYAKPVVTADEGDFGGVGGLRTVT
jgi:hypothetical protein